MPRLIVTTRDGAVREVEGDAGLTVMELIREAGFDELLAICGGCCSCATCRVHVDAAWLGSVLPMGQDEADLLDAEGHLDGTSRLSCQIPFTPELDGLRVTIAQEE